tara:strand:- start:3330 stop:3881 length:552 start_codon:yes stop_codon:yes gene_type:complete
MKTQKLRGLHRDLGYFYVGLIVSFAFSGLLMNHRSSWHAEKYTTESKQIEVVLPENVEPLSEPDLKKIITTLQIDDTFKRQLVRRNELRLAFNNTEVAIDLKTGKGEIISFIKTPLISQMMGLHKNTSNWWIYYSDIFAISLITIAVTGTLLVTHGKNTFKRRGWKLALAGLLFPLLFLLLVS